MMPVFASYDALQQIETVMPEFADRGYNAVALC